MIFLRRLIVSVCGVNFITEITKPEFFAVLLQSGCPFIVPLVKINSPKSRGCIGPLSAVAPILGLSCFAKIGPAVIKAVTIFVVND